MNDAPDVLLFFSDAGGGHRNAANALLDAAADSCPELRMRMLSLSEVLEPFDLLKRIQGRSIEETYNALLRNGGSAHMVALLRVLHGVTWLLHKPVVRALARRLQQERPRAVLSVHPNFNRELRDAVRLALPGVPFLVLMTDYADFPPHFWIEPGIDRLIVGSDHAREQALALGLPSERITRSSGMVLNPRFYRHGGAEARPRVRAELGVPEAAGLVLLLFGGKGAAEMEPLAHSLVAADPDWHVLAVCGRNPELLGRLQALERSAGPRLHSLGFTDRVADYMAAADVLLTKPGPGSLAEAFHERLPVVVTNSSETIPQERWNAAMVEREGLGLLVEHWRSMPAAALRLLRDAGLRAHVRSRLQSLPENRAVFEALQTLAGELKGGA